MRPKINLLDRTKKKKLMQNLEKEYGISDLPYLFVETGKGKFRAYSGALSIEELNTLGKNTRVEIIGMRILKEEDNKLRINFDAINVNEIKKEVEGNTAEIEDEKAIEWMKGENIKIEEKFDGNFIVIKNKGNILGIGQNRKDFVQNYVPKERRVKK